MRTMVKVGTLPKDTLFVTPLTGRLGIVDSPSGPEGGVVVSLYGSGEKDLFGGETDKGQRELHPDVQVEVAS